MLEVLLGCVVCTCGCQRHRNEHCTHRAVTVSMCVPAGAQL